MLASSGRGRPPETRSWWRRWAWPIGLIAIIGLGYAKFGLPGHKQIQATAPPQCPPVTTAAVVREDFPLVVTGLGLVQAGNSVTVRTRVDGQLQKVAFTEGQIIKAGDLLAQIDPSPYKATLDQAEAKLAQDQANLSNAERDLQRTTSLVDKGNATRQLFDQQTSTVSQVKALLLADKAAIEGARVQLDYTTIKAPISGRAGMRLIDAGNIVHASDQTGIVTIAQLEPIAVIFSAPETQLPAIRQAAAAGKPKVRALTSDGKQLLAEGELDVVDNTVDTATGTIRLKAVFANADHALWPGLSVSTELELGSVAGGTVVPETAVQLGPNGPYAYVVSKEGKAEMHQLEVGAIRGGKALIKSGVTPGDQVIVAGHYKVQPNGFVAVAQSTGDGATPAGGKGSVK